MGSWVTWVMILSKPKKNNSQKEHYDIKRLYLYSDHGDHPSNGLAVE